MVVVVELDKSRSNDCNQEPYDRPVLDAINWPAIGLFYLRNKRKAMNISD
jgi:hypothetical protein